MEYSEGGEMSREMRKGFTAEDIKNAIDNSDYTYTTIAAWLALNVSKNKTCKPETAKKYIQRFHLEAYLEMKMAEITRDALQTVRKSIKRGDARTSKWWLERVLRNTFGNEIKVNNTASDPLNINLTGNLMSSTELMSADEVKVE